MTVTVTQSRSEFARNSLRAFFHRGSGRWVLYISAALIIFSLLRWAAVPFGYGAPSPYLLVAGIGLLTLLPALIYRKAALTYDSNPLISQPTTYTFTEEGITTVADGINSHLRWDQIDSLSEAKDVVFLYYTKTISNPLPKHNFTEEQLERLRTLADRKG